MTKKQEKILEMIKDRNVAYKVYKKNVATRIISTVLAFILGLLLAGYGAIYLMRENTLFTIKIPEQTPQISLSLSNTVGFEEPTSRIQYDTKDTKLDNIDGSLDLPDGLNNIDGDHSGKNYLAYTFYLKNVGSMSAQVTAHLDITKVVLGADEAIRIMFYEDENKYLLAKQAADGNPEPDTTEFYDDSTAYNDIFILERNQVKKYTIVIWLEGNDPECINDILGGFVRLEMNFEAEKVPEDI